MSGVGQRLRNLREKKRPIKSQKITSELCGLHPDAIRRYEREESEPKLDALVAIADYYNVTTDYLLGRTEQKFL